MTIYFFTVNYDKGDILEKKIHNFSSIFYNPINNSIYCNYYTSSGGTWERHQKIEYIENEVFVPDPNLVYDMRMGKEVQGYKDTWRNAILTKHSTTFKKKDIENDSILSNNPRKYSTDVEPTIKYLSEHLEFDEEHDQLPPLHTLYFDIETKYGEGSFISPYEVGLSGARCEEGGVLLISSYDEKHDKTHIFSVNPYDEKKKSLPEKTVFVYCENEEKLLDSFSDYLKDLKPDIITGWNISSFDLPYILNRMAYYKGSEKGIRLGDTYAYWNNKTQRMQIRGISCLDYLPLYKKFELKPRRNYTLSNIAIEEDLKTDGEKTRKITYEGSMKEFSERDWEGFVEYCIQDSKLVYYLEQSRGFLKNLQLLCYMCRCPMEYALTEDLSWMRLHEASSYTFAKNQDIQLHDKRIRNDKDKKFAGAYVMNPEPAIYNNISVFDVASLYPSIIRALNLSVDTIRGEVIEGDVVKQNTKIRARFYDSLYMSLGIREEVYLTRANQYKKIEVPLDVGSPKEYEFANYTEFMQCMKQNNMCVAQNGAILTKDFRGIVPSLLDEFFTKRKKYKGQAFEARKKYQETKQNVFKDQEKRYDSLQGILKVLLNSFYGVMTCGTFRLNDKRLGEAVTKTGQTIIKGSRDAVQKAGVKVIYIDTDSVFLDYSKKMKEYGVERYEDDPEKYRQIVGELDNMVTNLINERMDKIAETMNCDNLFAFESEEIFSDIIFSSKKKYLAKYAYDKVTGNDVDKYAVKGLDLKKSAYSPKVKEWLTTLSKAILHKTPKKELCDKLLGIWNVMMNEDLSEISYSQGVRGIQKYAQDSIIEKYNDRKYTVKYANKTPYHVGGALMMNYLIANFPEFHNCDYVCEGDKCGVLFVAPNNIFGVSNLTYKGYLPRDVFDNYFQIDLVKTFERLILQPLEPLILAANHQIQMADILGCDLVGKGENMMAQNVLF